MSRLTDGQKLVICALICVIAVIAVWIFAFTPVFEKCSESENTILELQSDIERLQDLENRSDEYIRKAAGLNVDTQNVTEKYGAGNTAEKTIMFLVNMSKETNMSIQSISFGEETNVTVLSDGTLLSEAAAGTLPSSDTEDYPEDDLLSDSTDADAADGQASSEDMEDQDTAASSLSKASDYYLYNYPVTFSFNSSYSGLKQAVEYIVKYGERMTIEDLSAGYDSASGRLAGSITLNMYTLTGTQKTYLAPAVPEMSLGQAQLFGTVE